MFIFSNIYWACTLGPNVLSFYLSSKYLLWCNSEPSWRLASEWCIYGGDGLEGCGNMEEATSFRGLRRGVCQEKIPKGLCSWVELKNSWIRRGCPSMCLPCRSHPAQWRMSCKVEEAGSSLTPVYNLGLSRLTGSSRLSGSSVVWIAPEFSSGRQVSQSKHWAFCQFLFCCWERLNVSCSVSSLPN